MIILDCETYQSTISSLVDIYDITADKIEEFFSSFDIDKHYEINGPDCMGDEELRNVFEQRLKLQPKTIDKVCWFHLTRALPDENFNEGILPLSKSLEKVWDVIFNMFKDTVHYDNLKAIKASGVDNFQYNHKAGVDLHAGPYAMLVKDVAFHSQDIGHHDYLRTPEIIEDICNGYEKCFGVSIIGNLENSLEPKIIKFISSKKTGVSCIEAALYYAYRICNHQNLSLNTNTCFDGENIEIPYYEIVNT